MAYEKAMSTLGNVTQNTRDKAYLVMDYCQQALGRTPGVLWGKGSSSEHATGRAIDFMVSQHGFNGYDVEMGDTIAAYLLENGSAFGLAWIIWRQRIFPGSGSFVAGGGFAANPHGGWRFMENRGSDTQNHYDHVHAYFMLDTAVNAQTIAPPPNGGAPGLPQPFPLPRNHYYGLITGPERSHGGYYVNERPVIKVIQQRLIAKGYVPGITNPNNGWADGLFEQPTADAVTRFQQAEMPNTEYYGQVWWDDYEQLSK